MGPDKETGIIDELVTAMPVAAYAADGNWKVTYFNTAAEDLTGISSSEAIGLRVRDVFNGAIGKIGEPIFDNISEGKPATVSGVKYTNNKEIDLVCSFTARPFLGKDGKVTGSIGFVSVESKNDMTSDIVNSVPAPILAVDRDMKIIFMNRTALEWVGKDIASVLGKHCYDILKTEHCKNGECSTKKAMLDGRHFVGETVAHLPSGDRPIRGNIDALKDSNGAIVGAIEILDDISKEKKTVSQVKELAQRISAGDVKARADISGTRGDFKEMLEGLNATMDAMESKMFWYERIIDSIPFPLSVTDMDMCTTFINKAATDLLKCKREDMIGKQCSEWKGKICKTKDCGIIRLREGFNHTMSDRDGKATQIDVQFIKNAEGENIGHVEVLQDMTKAVRRMKYEAKEVERLAHNIDQLAEGKMELDINIAEADEYTAQTRESYVKIMERLVKARDSIAALVDDSVMLANSLSMVISLLERT